jgi:hypothetical protein
MFAKIHPARQGFPYTTPETTTPPAPGFPVRAALSSGPLGAGSLRGPEPFSGALHGKNTVDPFNHRGARRAGIVVLCKLIGLIQWKASEQVSLGGCFRISRTGTQVWHRI